ncbi:DUF3800 domain-containing protein [Thermovorax subterraneus]|nr:DUF3800 domain-containing protein [Thermovorax subterraneus]
MYLLYVDESGDPGLINSPTTHFILNGLIVHSNAWFDALDGIIKLRKELKKEHGIRVRTELKGKYFYKNKGEFYEKKIKPEVRLEIYKKILNFEVTSGYFKTLFVCVNKSYPHTRDPKELAWQSLLERFQRFLQSAGERGMVFPDDGYIKFVTQLQRKMRRYNPVKSNFTGEFYTDYRILNILEDPSARNSVSSYFIQLSDMNAYALHKYITPARGYDTLYPILDSSNVLVAEVSKLKGGKKGIVCWPGQCEGCPNSTIKNPF